MQIAVIIGIGAGLASAVLYASAWTGTVLGLFVLFFLSPMPVAIAGFGWGSGSGTIAAAVGAVTVLASGGMRSGLVYLIAVGAPAAVFSYFAMLNRVRDDDGTLEWYPIGRIVAWATLWAALASCAGLLGIGSDAASIRAAIQELLEKSMLLEGMSQSGAKITPEQRAGFAALMTAFLPWAFATTWFMVAILNLWAAGHVILRSGRLMRPWPDLSAISLPPGMGLAFGAAAIGMMAGNMTALLASCFASALLFAFMLVGLGVLHRLTQGYAVRPLLLAIVYTGLMLLPPFSNLLVAMVGLSEPYLRGRIPPGAPPQPPPAA